MERFLNAFIDTEKTQNSPSNKYKLTFQTLMQWGFYKNSVLEFSKISNSMYTMVNFCLLSQYAILTSFEFQHYYLFILFTYNLN